MNDQTIAFLERLSQKLGTTSEMLWASLLKQAHIVSYECVAGMILFFLVAFLFVVFNPAENESKKPAAIFVCVFCGMIIIALATEFIGAFYNPEYWALQQILQTIK